MWKLGLEGSLYPARRIQSMRKHLAHNRGSNSAKGLMRRFPFAILFWGICWLLIGCSSPSPALTITTTTLATAVENAPYSATLGATGGTPPYTWSILSGTLPSGITLSSAGVLSGTPASLGTFDFTVQVLDSANTQAAVRVQGGIHENAAKTFRPIDARGVFITTGLGAR